VQLSRTIVYKAAALRRALSQRLGENDAWIAVTALVYDAELASRENAFKRVPPTQIQPVETLPPLHSSNSNLNLNSKLKLS